MLRIVFDATKPEYRPGEMIAGEVVWDELPAATKTVGVRLLWYTQGKGDRDIDLVAESDVAIGATEVGGGRQRFEFVAPHRPYSFSGKLIELSWAVEAVVLPANDSVLEQVFISATGTNVTLNQSFDDSFSKRKKPFWTNGQ
jgi:hypothetical protein